MSTLYYGTIPEKQPQTQNPIYPLTLLLVILFLLKNGFIDPALFAHIFILEILIMQINYISSLFFPFLIFP